MDERVARVKEFIERKGIKAQIIEFDTSTKNSQLAASALGCPVAQIAKSIVFSHITPLVVVLSGDKRVNIKKLSGILGGPASLADAETVLRFTGFPVGGVPPFAHNRSLRVLLDKSLKRFEDVYPAAGSPNAVFKISVRELKISSNAEVVDVAA